MRQTTNIQTKGGVIPLTLKIIFFPVWGPLAFLDYLWCNYRWFQWRQPYRSWHCTLFGHHTGACWENGSYPSDNYRRCGYCGIYKKLRTGEWVDSID